MKYTYTKIMRYIVRTKLVQRAGHCDSGTSSGGGAGHCS